MYKILSLLAVVSAALTATGEEVTGTVKATNLNVRVLPGTSYSVVATLQKGETVTVLARKDKWIKIKAPKSSSVWISISCVKDNTVVKETKLRSGPGISYNDFGTIKKSTKVKLLEEKRGEWARMEVPDELTAWTSSDYVEMPATASLKTEDISLPEPPKESKPAADPLPFESKPKDVTLEGVIVSVSSAVYVTHAIAVQKKNEYVPAAFLHSKKSLKPYENKLVKIRGFQRKVKGWKLPMIEVDSVKPVE
ncbi:MAG: SH3 domain-containing protein [Candidatus Izemoplasmatales bacterium]|nr:SH3 domain-containing protein [Candidatus Izemoplasmatales bacterium]